MNVEPLTEEEIATLSANLYYPQEYSLYHALLATILWRTQERDAAVALLREGGCDAHDCQGFQMLHRDEVDHGH